MTVEQLEILITANSDDFNNKLSAVNENLAEFEQKTASVYSKASEIFNFNGKNIFGGATNENVGIGLINGAVSGILEEKNGIKNINEFSINALNNSLIPQYNKAVSAPESGQRRISENLRDTDKEKASDILKIIKETNDYNSKEINRQPIHLSNPVELDGEILSENIVSYQNNKLIRLNGKER